jgi:hypothetical protein
MSLTVAAPKRSWMEATSQSFALRCLPMLIANQAGWWVVLKEPLRARWNGSADLQSVAVDCSEAMSRWAVSHFGHGILTFRIPYLFQTPPGCNLWVRGPANWPKDAIVPLEGLVETDWSVASFTMNWKLTRKDCTVDFEAGEPIAMIVPQYRGTLEQFAAQIRPLRSNRALFARYKSWRESRGEFLKGQLDGEPEVIKARWQKHYFQGKNVNEDVHEHHQTKLQLRPFTKLRAKVVPGKKESE